MEFDDLSNRVIGCAIEVRRELGPGLLESSHEQRMARERNTNGVSFQPRHPRPVDYKGIQIDFGHRINVLIEDQLISDLKALEEIKGLHGGQLLT